MRTCVRPAVSALRVLTSEKLLLRLRTAARKDFRTPDPNNEPNLCWITNYEKLVLRVILRAAVTAASARRPLTHNGTCCHPLRETCHPNYWLMSSSCRSFTHGKWRTFVLKLL